MLRKICLIISFLSKPAMSLKWLLVPYNFYMACLNAYIAFSLLGASYRLNYSYVCQPCRPIHSPDEIKVRKGVDVILLVIH